MESTLDQPIRKDDVNARYKTGKVIGEGSFAVVREVLAPLVKFRRVGAKIQARRSPSRLLES